MISETSEQLKLISSILSQVCDAHISDFDTISSIQNEVITFGNQIDEKYNLDNTPIIKSLETIADLLYSICQNPTDEAFDALLNMAASLEESIKSSKEISHSRMSLVLIIKNEASYVREWIEFHNMLGVDHFYIYDNESEDNLKDVLNPYIEDGLVTYHFWPGRVVQIPAYNHAIEHYKYDTEYMGFIDTDEFLFPIDGFSLPDTIDKVFDTYDHHIAKAYHAGGIGVNWRSYGTSHIKEKPEGLVIENYTLRGFDDYPQNVHIKTIVKPTLAKGFVNNPHSLIYNDSTHFTISEHGSMIPSAFFYDGHCDLLRINHYYTRSESELYYKMKIRGWADVPDNLQKEYANSFDERLTACNDYHDDIMDRFIEPLKNRISDNNYVSIIIPTYNRAHSIMDSINSVLNQTYPYFELLIIDDGSTDGTETLIKSINDDRVKYYKTTHNNGASAARNYGISVANYKYIAFHDSDDIWLPEKLEKQMSLITSDSSLGMVYCQMLCHNVNKEMTTNSAVLTPDDSIPESQKSGMIFEYLLKRNIIGIPTMLIRKECLTRVGILNESYKALEDWELALRIAKEYPIGFINEPLYVYNISSSGNVSANHAAYFEARINMLDSFREDMEKYSIFDDIIQDIISKSKLVGVQDQVTKMIDLYTK